MKLGAAGRALLERWEGNIPHAYHDYRGFPTVGVGHLIRHGEDFGPFLPVHDPTRTVSEERIDALLEADIAESVEAVNGLGVELTQSQFDALVCFTFNLGPGIMHRGHTLADCLRAGDFAGAANAFKLYDHSGGKEDAGLLERRMSERELFLRPDTVDEDCPATDPGA